jgi:putative glutamine amidotransferase
MTLPDAADPAAPAPGAQVPCVWIASSHRLLGNEHGHPQCYTVMDEVGTRTVLNLGLQPVCFPRVPAGRLPQMLAQVQGVLLGGSATNVHPRHYGEEPTFGDQTFDEARDAVTLPLVRLCIEQRVPLIAICRGSHEFNVAMGGSLHQRLQALGGDVVHWEDPEESLDEQYAERHEVRLLAGGELERITGCRRFPASSLHSQGIKRLAPGLVAEAIADDGLVEAFRWHDARQFAWGFQFHPEWGHQAHPRYGRIMAAYVQACWARMRAQAGAATSAGLAGGAAEPGDGHAGARRRSGFSGCS